MGEIRNEETEILQGIIWSIVVLDVGHLSLVDSVAMINLDSLNQTRLITTDYG